MEDELLVDLDEVEHEEALPLADEPFEDVDNFHSEEGEISAPPVSPAASASATSKRSQEHALMQVRSSSLHDQFSRSRFPTKHLSSP